MRLPQVQFYQTAAKLDIRSGLGSFEIESQKASMDIRSENARLEFETEMPVVIVDMSKTKDALTGGPHLSFMNRLYDQFGKFVISAIENTVSEYNQIGDLTIKSNPIPDLARQSQYRQPPSIQLFGAASPANVSFNPMINQPKAEYTPAEVIINITPSKPKINYQRAEVHIQMAQYPSVTFTTPQIDLLN